MSETKYQRKETFSVPLDSRDGGLQKGEREMRGGGGSGGWGSGGGGCEGGAKLCRPLSLLGIMLAMGCLQPMSVRRIVPGGSVPCLQLALCFVACIAMLHILHGAYLSAAAMAPTGQKHWNPVSGAQSRVCCQSSIHHTLHLHDFI